MTEEYKPSANDYPEYHGKLYNPGAAEDSRIVCDYAHDTRCDGTCLTWTNELLGRELYPHQKICFPTFDWVYGNCSIERTMYENSTVNNRRQAYNTRKDVEDQIYAAKIHKPRPSKDCPSKKRSIVDEIPRKTQFQRLTTTKSKTDDKKESLVNKVPEYRGKRYNPAATAVGDIVCDYAHDTRCDGTCLLWTDDLLGPQMFPEDKKICFPSFDEDFGNCSAERTNFEICFKVSPDAALEARTKAELRVLTNLRVKPEKLLKDGSNKKLSDFEQRSLSNLVDQVYEQHDLSYSEAAFVSKVPLLCECYRTPLFCLNQKQFYKRVVQAFEAHACREILSWDSTEDILDVELPTVLLRHYP
jgi:hypothetical protein